MEIVTFQKQHIEEAKAIVFANYQQEQGKVGILPKIEEVPDLSWFAENGLGVAAVEEGVLVGFLCCVGSFDNAFGTNAKGTFSPIHAHGALTENRVSIYRRMYQRAAEIWVEQGILYHAIALYAHDRLAQEALFLYGFGARCADAIRDMEPICCTELPGYTFRQLPKSEVSKLRPMRRALAAHLGTSPCFMKSHPEAEEAWLAHAEQRDSQVFVAEKDELLAAFVEVRPDGENFITELPAMANICGAYCLPEFRGKGVTANLLNEAISQLREQGITLLGVDHETANSTALGAWSKYFTHYTYSLTRRVDECALSEKGSAK